MKALSIVAPNGERIARGEKTLEIRRWAPGLGPGEDLLIVQNRRYLRQDGEEDPDGRAVALVRVAAVRPFVAADIEAACAGSFEEGWLAWELTDIRPLSRNAKVRAARGIYEITGDFS
ncbi:MAG: ASCH domain-containing protein [Paracoccaceae bacterium]